MENNVISIKINHEKSNSDIYKLFTPSSNRNGLVRSPNLLLPTYFIRLLGFNNIEDYSTLIRDVHHRLSADKISVIIMDNLDNSTDPSLVNGVKSIFSSITNLNNSTIEDITTATIKANLIKFSFESEKFSFIESMTKISQELLRVKPNYSVTQYRNFYIKILHWFNIYMIESCNKFHSKLNKAIYNIPKLMVFADIKVSEALFITLCNLMGYDTICFFPETDAAFEKLDPNAKFSDQILLPNRKTHTELKPQITFGKPKLSADKLVNTSRTRSTPSPTVTPRTPTTSNSSSNSSSGKSRQTTNASRPVVNTTRPNKAGSINTSLNSSRPSSSASISTPPVNPETIKKLLEPLGIQDKITTSLKISKTPFEDFITVMNTRGGYVGGPSPIFTVYFYRIIGVDINLNTYYNKLYRLNNSLVMKDNYAFFDNGIKVLADQDAVSKTSALWQLFETVDKNTSTLITNYLYKNSVFPYFSHKLLENTLLVTFKKILDFYLDSEEHVTKNTLKNFTLKLLFWARHFLPKLYKGLDIDSTSIYNPKVIYYGNIKKHEGYLLMLFSLLGVDILYINSKDDTFFTDMDPSNAFSKPFILESTSPMRPFPTQEIVTQQETVAFRASQEINEILFDETTGVYAPWQFENYLTHAHTLKTTYDELKILWNEESRMRDGFKIKGDTVYVPNVFAKISGTSEDISSYWGDLKDFKTSENSIFLDKIPFTNIDQATSDSYAAGFVFKSDGSLDVSRLKSNSIYKIGHLKNGTQNLIMSKIQELCKSKVLNMEKDKLLSQKILMTIMNLGNEVFNIISSFDKPFSIPKLIIYDNDEKMFSLEDSITIVFMYLLGFDIIILTPTGYNNIENFISPSYFNTIHLEKVQFNLELPNFARVSSRKKEKSFFSTLFGK